jgi:RNase P subunit RPR2
MAKRVICENCKEVLEPSTKDYIVCGNCGEFQWVGSENQVKEEDLEPDLRTRLRIAKEKIIKAHD